MRKFERVISRTQSVYKLQREKKYITQQCSYNLPIEMEGYLIDLNAITRLTPFGDETHVLYELKNDYDVELSNNIITIIGKEFVNKNNKVIFTHTEEENGKTPKFQLKKTDFAQKGEDYKWFVELYMHNFEGSNFIVLIDESNKKIKFDVELTESMFDEIPTENTTYNDANFYGMHIKNTNTCLSEEYPHICLGWGLMGDLTNVQSKEELEELHKRYYADNNHRSRSQAISMINLFRFDLNIGDVIVYFDGKNANIGKVTSNYYYNSSYEGDTSDYGSKRDVTWLKSIPYNDLNPDFRNRASVSRSIYSLNVFKSYIIGLINGINIKDEGIYEDSETLVSTFDFNSSPITDGQNLIVYGTPGCGKSYYVEHTLTNGWFHKIRTTFYQDYTNTDFVGQILPMVNGDKVSYEFIPGPFTLALEKAIANPDEKVALIIEELNRGNAASIFGDIFQLLDRNNYGVSEYSIQNINIINYLNKKFAETYEFDEIKIPSNLFIFATMNTSDQNVYTLDTAFKRRWKFKKLTNEFNEEHGFKNRYVPGADVTWKDLVHMVNNYMLAHPDMFNTEDKQIGVYFVDSKGMRENVDITSSPQEVEEFAYKVFEYLWDDVAKFHREKWFDPSIKSLDQLVDKYKANGIKVFSEDVVNSKE